jgi:alpha-tubulin suppressor-like RCC1 family protein
MSMSTAGRAWCTTGPIAPELDDIVSVSLGIGYRCVTRATGTTLCWGYGPSGQLGVGDVLTHNEPTTLPGTWQALATGNDTVCGISDGSLSCWGSNAHGVRGTGFLDFARVGDAADWSTVGLGYSGGCGLRGTGDLYCWGLFVAGTTDGYTPVRIGSASDWSRLSVGDVAQCAIRNGELYCWGSSDDGALGLGAITEASAPARVGSDDDWLSVSVRTDHACGIRNGGDLYCWGSNMYRALGTASAANSHAPVLVSAGGWQSVAAGYQHSCGVRSGQLHCWGARHSGAVGNGAANSLQTTPLQIGDGTSWTRAFAGWSTSGALDTSGALHVWGQNTFGELGMPASPLSPVAVPTQLGTATGWTALQSAAFHTCGVRSGMLYCWGGNDTAELGQPTGESLATPTRVGDSSTWQAVTVTSDSSCAIDAGALFCFGSNEDGKLASPIGLRPMPVLNVSALQ